MPTLHYSLQVAHQHVWHDADMIINSRNIWCCEYCIQGLVESNTTLLVRDYQLRLNYKVYCCSCEFFYISVTATDEQYLENFL